ncbi:MAG TPA: adenylate/guanylate cyclase domain-containing protein, partial [Herpetosiphonaceae bacterium]
MQPSLPATPPAGADPALVSALAAYIPETLADELAGLAEAGGALPVAQARRLECVTMMVDITGFTPLCEALARTGREGAERVTELINSFFSQALRPVRELGGVVTKFGGDAFQAFFERGPGEPWAEPALRALRSAWVLQSVVNEYAPVAVAGPDGAQEFRLAAKVGLSAGTLALFTVGDPALHCDVQVAGPAANQAADAEHEAAKGDVMVHRALLERCGELAGATFGERRGPCV